jgi:hypothetical protein
MKAAMGMLATNGVKLAIVPFVFVCESLWWMWAWLSSISISCVSHKCGIWCPTILFC